VTIDLTVMGQMIQQKIDQTIEVNVAPAAAE
jgi:hypothetical protein